MATIKSLKDAKEYISPDVVYQEMYQEMRRYRDYEFTSAQWYTGFLVIILGAMLTIKRLDPIILILIIMISILLTCGGVFSVIYAKSRYEELRKWVIDNYEPSWKKYKPKPTCIKPWVLIVISQAMLCIIIIVIAHRKFLNLIIKVAG